MIGTGFGIAAVVLRGRRRNENPEIENSQHNHIVRTIYLFFASKVGHWTVSNGYGMVHANTRLRLFPSKRKGHRSLSKHLTSGAPPSLPPRAFAAPALSATTTTCRPRPRASAASRRPRRRPGGRRRPARRPQQPGEAEEEEGEKGLGHRPR